MAHAGTLDAPKSQSTRWDTLRGWLLTTDHKKLGLMYIFFALLFFLWGGIYALLMRIQLAYPENTFLNNELYNSLMTMHGTTMVFMFVMPISVGLGNYLVPLMIGARDMAFPKMNAFSLWMFVFASFFLQASPLFGGPPDKGWFAYAPLTEPQYSPTVGMDFWALSVLMLAISSTASAINFIITVAQLRAPGMVLSRVPLFVWMVVVMSFLALFSFPSLGVAAIMLLFDRTFGTHFFNPAEGGSALLWQHLFWFFGHPEVYILVLPSFGIISEIIPVFSRKRLFSYKTVILSGVIIGVLGFTVWAHHMLATGMPEAALLLFSADSFLIGIPTGIKVFAWLATMWGGQLRFRVPMLFSLAFIVQFTIGGITGIHLASIPVDWQLTDTYYVVAHFHYVLIGGALFALMGALYYWYPKLTGRMLDERLGRVHFIFLFLGINLTFFPMHFLGIQGMPRRIYTYADGLGWNNLNLVATAGAFLIFIGMSVFVINLIVTHRRPRNAPANPWDGFTLEWLTSSPPPPYNFETIPTVASPRPVWDLNHPDFADSKLDEH